MEKANFLTGGTPKSVVALLEGLGVDALGINCGLGPVQMKPIVEELLRYASIPVVVNPNAGLPRSEGGKTVYDIDPPEFVEEMKGMLEMGVSAVGGCCGTTPEHIRLLAEMCKGRTRKPIEPKNDTLITSYASVVEMGTDPVIIGERINPTGKSKFKQALRDHNLEYILREAITQQENGAAVLDVNVGLPEIDEVAMMREVVQELQAVTELPLQIDTTDTEAMEQALRIYNGKALINSVNGKQEVMDAVFPLVKHYGGTVVALTIDEEGIPATADGRMAIARKNLCGGGKSMASRKRHRDRCALYDDQLRADRRAGDTGDGAPCPPELGCNTILGVSNISFGLPQREIVNSNFFTMAMQSGLTAAIISPNSAAMMRSYYSYRVLWQHWMNTAAIILSRQRGWRFQRQVWAELPRRCSRQRRFGCPGGRCSWSFRQCDTGSQASGPEHQLTVSVERFKRAGGIGSRGTLKDHGFLTVINSLHDPGTR